MASGPVVAMVWQGLDAVKTGRVMLGATNPLQSPVGTRLDCSQIQILFSSTSQAPSVATFVSLSAATFATAPTLSRAPKRRLLCTFIIKRTFDALLTPFFTCSWFPEGVVQYTSAMENWIFE